MAPSVATRPSIIGHRGSRSTAPENSIAGFQAALGDRVGAVECDVRLTRDGVVVCSHDGSMERLGGSGDPIAQLTLADLRHRPLPGGDPVPTLDAVLDTLQGRGAIVIELKNGIDGGALDPTHAIAPAVSALLRGRREAGRADVVRAVSSFNVDTLSVFQAADPELAPLTALLGGPEKSARKIVREADARGITNVHLHFATLLRTPFAVGRASRAGIAVTAWTVNHRTVARLLLAMGVIGIISDCPQRLLKLIR